MNNWFKWDSKTEGRFILLFFAAIIISVVMAFCMGKVVQGQTEEPVVETEMFYSVEE